jgi:hypothetical protein
VERVAPCPPASVPCTTTAAARGKTVEYERQVIEFYASKKDFFQQGEIADEAARVCLDSGDLDAAYKWYKTGHDTGLEEPDIKPARRDLWDFRWEHAQARIAAHRGDQAEAQKHRESEAVGRPILHANIAVLLRPGWRSATIAVRVPRCRTAVSYIAGPCS